MIGDFQGGELFAAKFGISGVPSSNPKKVSAPGISGLKSKSVRGRDPQLITKPIALTSVSLISCSMFLPNTRCTGNRPFNVCAESFLSAQWIYPSPLSSRLRIHPEKLSNCSGTCLRSRSLEGLHRQIFDRQLTLSNSTYRGPHRGHLQHFLRRQQVETRSTGPLVCDITLVESVLVTSATLQSTHEVREKSVYFPIEAA